MPAWRIRFGTKSSEWTACRTVTKIRGEIAENDPYTGILPDSDKDPIDKRACPMVGTL